MKAVGFTFDDFNFVINPFQFACVDGVITVIENAILVSFQHISKTVN